MTCTFTEHLTNSGSLSRSVDFVYYMNMGTKMAFRLQNLRKAMMNSKFVESPIQAYIIPSFDAHQSEYISDHDKRREYISGFTGSAGTAVVTNEKAALWTDGRYHIQASQQLDENWILMKEGLPETPTYSSWLCNSLKVGSQVGIDPFTITFDYWEKISKQLNKQGLSLVPIHTNLIDEIWDDQPPVPTNKVNILEIEFAGKSWQEKVDEIRRKMNKKEVYCLVISDLAEIAWLLNLRGSDIEYNPVFFSYVLMTKDCIHFFIDSTKLGSQVTNHLQDENFPLKIHDYAKIIDFLSNIIKENSEKVWISNQSSFALVDIIPELRRHYEMSPIQIMKAVKNSTEIKGMIESHIQDGMALCEYFHWLESTVGKEKVTEISGASKLAKLRSEQQHFVDLSFSSISSSGSNGAIIHYTPTEQSDKEITLNEIYLCDSGGQYKNGTTDVTRTWHFGSPSEYEKECYTRVLKGHIALSTAVFPVCTKGNKLDTLARISLWNVGLDYLHGTGHGVGSFLNVHEGPMGIHYRENSSDPGLMADMIMTIEPGYYESGKFGMRVENVVHVKKAQTKFNVSEKGSLTFEPITLHPLQIKLMERSLLTDQEVSWIDNYHQKCRDVLGPRLKLLKKNEVYDWLLKETEPL